MNNESLSDTIIPNSTQLNADDLIAGPITVTVEGVRRSSSPDQPIDIMISGHRPFRPCKSMRRVLISVWGDKGSEWIGQSMTLYRDENVKYGGIAVGGIRISHVTGIDKRRDLMLTSTRSKREMFSVNPMRINDQYILADYQDKINSFNDKDALRKWMLSEIEKNGWSKSNPICKTFITDCARRAAQIDNENNDGREESPDDFDAGLGDVED